ncbi:hypothetical protein FHX37_2801 [Haloactinospora alba]|uniref:Integral membrane protein n=1 Tax=Haloactinospora alba TaxID=405555 RepID=A0A543NLY6_9ACTN|nr:hypothetical protein [Haloactinospora alba]TQN32817.1 hypothetical protein FHX37_2801 [Haloactinospora alba]
MPSPLRGARVLLFLFGALSALVFVGGLMAADVDGRVVGRLLWVALPGVVATVLALRLPRGGRGVFWTTVGLQVFSLLQALGNLGAGQPQGLLQMVLPTVVLVLVTRPASRSYLVR